MSGYTADVIYQKEILDEDVKFGFKAIAPAPLLDKIRSVLGAAGPTAKILNSQLGVDRPGRSGGRPAS